MHLPFKNNASAFEYACRYLDCTIEAGRMLPAIVEDSRVLFGTKSSAHLHDDDTQTVVLRVAGADSGFLALARTDTEMFAENIWWAAAEAPSVNLPLARLLLSSGKR